MLTKCANPACTTSLHYLREGKILMYRFGRQTESGRSSVEHFWLCGLCSQSCDFAPNSGTVSVIPKKNLSAYEHVSGSVEDYRRLS
jgi:hypothetical protein